MANIEQLKEAIAYGRGEFDLDDILTKAKEGAMQIWRLPDNETIGVTEFIHYPKKKRVRVILLAGFFSESVVTFFEGLAKSLNYDGVELIGREGWIRKLKPYGYEKASVNLVKDFRGRE